MGPQRQHCQTQAIPSRNRDQPRGLTCAGLNYIKRARLRTASPLCTTDQTVASLPSTLRNHLKDRRVQRKVHETTFPALKVSNPHPQRAAVEGRWNPRSSLRSLPRKPLTHATGPLAGAQLSQAEVQDPWYMLEAHWEPFLVDLQLCDGRKAWTPLAS